MSLDIASAHELIRKLNEDRTAYLDSVNRLTDTLVNAIAAAEGSLPSNPPPLANTVLQGQDNTATASKVADEQAGSGSSWWFQDGDESDEDETGDPDDELFAKGSLLSEQYDTKGLRKHIQEYRWTTEGRRILRNVLNNEKTLEGPSLFPNDILHADDRSHLTHLTIFNVGPDGKIFDAYPESKMSEMSRSIQIWSALRSTNAKPE